jgi:hypothetical protein
MENENKQPLAWMYMLGDGIPRYQRNWSNGAVMHPVYELTPEIEDEIRRREERESEQAALNRRAIEQISAPAVRG